MGHANGALSHYTQPVHRWLDKTFPGLWNDRRGQCNGFQDHLI